MGIKRSSKKTKEVFHYTKLQKKSYAWHAHDFREVLSVIGVCESGLTLKAVAQRRKKFGYNLFTEIAQDGIFIKIWKQLRSPLVFVLVVAFIITVALKEYIDASVIFFALAIAVSVGVFQEGRASRAFKKLADSQEHVATVIRDGQKHEIISSELVVGDIVEINNGAQVPADIRLIKTKNLYVNESAVTGEWLAIEKYTEALPIGTPLIDKANMAWMGTFVAEGFGLGVVVTTGDSTVVGELASNLHDTNEVETPLQHEIHKISVVMLYIIGFLVLGIFAIGLLTGQSVHDMLLMSIAIAVAAVPEGLPAAITIILAVGMEALLKRGGLVRNLLAAETLGSTTYILTDKTGTLTQARMALTGIIHGTATNMTPQSWQEDDRTREILHTALYATDAYVDVQKKEQILRGNPIEKVILQTATEIGITSVKEPHHKKRLDYLAFTSENRFAAGLVAEDNEFRLCINGAPEYLLENAMYMYTQNNSILMSQEHREQFQKEIDEHTKGGRRLVAVSYKEVGYDDIPDDPSFATSLITKSVFMGILVFNDPVRLGVKGAIKGVRDAGARVVLITGDNAQTALSVASQVGIAEESETVLTGDDLTDLSDVELVKVLQYVHVFARVLPKQKLRIAQVLQGSGEIVAMTGDGINDAPALVRANIGIAIGSGTEVAKESSDLILMNDSFEIIYAAIEEGRRIISNLRKIVGYLLSTSLTEVALIGASLLTGAAVPILPAQILWANVIEEGLMSVAFAFEKGEKDAMKRTPQDIHEEGILSPNMLWFTVFVVTVLSTLTVTLYFYLRSTGLPLEQLRSAMFLAISIDSLFMAFSFRSLTVPVWQIPLSTNKFFLGSFFVSLFLLLIVTTVPFFQFLLSYTPLSLFYILLVLGVCFAALVTVEVCKWAFFRKNN